MNNSGNTAAQTKPFWKKVAIAALASTVVLGNYIPPVPADAKPVKVSKKRDRQDWQAALHCARLTDTNQLLLQLDLLDRPATSYANVAYFIYARRSDQWVQVFTNTGARLITEQSGRVTLAPELFPIAELQRRLGTTDLSNVELKVTSLVRYDVRGGAKRQTVQFERILRYAAIAQTTTTQFASYTSTTQLEALQTTQVVYNPGSPFGTQPLGGVQPVAYSTRQEQSRFSLAIVQKADKRIALSNVIARVSLKARNSQTFLQEQFIGDFRYKLKGKKYKARFIKGLYAGDRVVVRLFTTDNRLIGYSEFELLSRSTAVTLVLPDRPLEYGIVRTIYGVDRDEDFAIDRNTQIYDYFTQVTQTQSFESASVAFFSTLQTVSLSLFDVSGLPAPRPSCTYPTSFLTGSFTLVNQVIRVFSSSLTSVLASFPGQLVRMVDISTTSVSTYEVSQQITTYQQVNGSSGTLIYTSDDDRGGKKPGKRHCNQGIGNGSEGCDPGNSRPHGGSNDGD